MGRTPYRLRLFGTGHPEDPVGMCTGRVSQPQQLAFLALVGTPPGGMTRDRIGAYLWPERPSSEARHRVADVLYVLRGTLGDDSLVTAGECVCLSPSRIDCDVTRFREAHASGDRTLMLELYEGPFLDGFHGAGGVEFQRWVETERLRCQEVALGAVARLATECEERGDVPGAVEWLRRGRSVDPFDEEIARRLMRPAARAGNRAEAVRTYRFLRRRLWKDLGLRPSPEMQALQDEIRGASRWGAEAPAPNRPS